MGAAYSVGPFLPAVRPLVEQQVEWVDARFARHKQWLWKGTQQDVARGTIFYADTINNDAFLDLQALQFVFELSDAQTLAISQVFDPAHMGNMLVTEIWSAIILGANMPMKAKIDRLCAIVSAGSAGNNQHLNLVELMMLLQVATRAFSRMKGRELVPATVLDDVLHSFRVAYGYGDEDTDEEVQFAHVRAFAAGDERCRTYLQNLGATVEIKDADNLIDQRTKIELQLLDVSTIIENGKDLGEAHAIMRERFKLERGGDADVIIPDRTPTKLATFGAFFENQAALQRSASDQTSTLNFQHRQRSDHGLHDPFRASKKKQELAAIGIADASMLEEQCSDWWAGVSIGDDRTAVLSLPVVAELFESVGIVLTEDEARECLNHVKPNAVGRCSLTNIVEWWVKRPFFSAASNDSPAWRRFGRSCASIIRGAHHQMQATLRQLRVQHSSLLQSNQLHKATRIKGSAMGDDPLQQRGSAYLASWQRSRSHLPPSRWILLATFGDDGEEVKDRDAPLGLDIEFACVPKEQNSHPPMASWHISSLSDLNAGRLLEKHPAGFVIWFVISAENTNESQLRLVADSMKAALLSIPWDQREGLYHTVQSEIMTVGESKTPHAIIMLLHPTDQLHNIESQLPPGLFVTRALRNTRLKLFVNDSLESLRLRSLEFVDFARKLFGVQESELAAQDFHPAVLKQKREEHEQTLAQQIQQLSALPTESLMQELHIRGYNNSGNRVDLESRLRAVLLDDIERVKNNADISAFGREMVKKIFQHFDRDRDGGLNFHEFNEMLDRFGLSVMYDQADYRAMLEESGFSTTTEGNLNERGLLAYYVKHGQLAHDASILGFGSLSNLLSGRMEINCSYDSEAVWSFKSLFEKHLASMKSLKWLHALSTLARHCSMTLHSDSLKTLLVDLSSMLGLSIHDEWASQPGWLVRWLDNITEKLSNNAQGILPEMRASVTRHLHKMYSAYGKSDWSGLAAEDDSNHPVSPPSCTNDEDLPKRIDDLLNSLIELNRAIRDRATTTKQKEAALNQKYDAEKQLRELCDSVERMLHICAAHMLKVYDGIRQTSTTMVAVGFGTTEMNCRCLLRGFQLAELLPPGLGEPSRPEQAELDRANRTKAKRQAAIDEFEQERLLKLQAEAESTRLAQQREAQRRQQQEAEEQALYAKAERALQNVTADSDIVLRKATVASWEALSAKLQQRYPGTLKALVGHNNLSVAVATLFGDDELELQRVADVMEEISVIAMAEIAHTLRIDELERGDDQQTVLQFANSVDVEPDQLFTMACAISNFIAIQRRVAPTTHVMKLIPWFSIALSMLGTETCQLTSKAITVAGMRTLLLEPIEHGMEVAHKWLYDIENPIDLDSANRTVAHLRRKAINVDEVEHSAGLEGLFLLDIGEAADAKAGFLRRKAIDRRKIVHRQRQKLHAMVRDASIISHFAERAQADMHKPTA